VTEAGLSLRLKGGRISEIVPVSSAKPVRRWASTTAEGVALRIRREAGSERDFSGGLRSHLENMLFDLLARILEAAVYQRHGAAIALLPKTGWQRHIHFEHAAAGVDVGRMAVGYWGAFLQGQQSEPGATLRLPHTKRVEILLGCNSLAWVANIDGYVGLSEELALWGFGGEILVSQAEALEFPRTFGTWNATSRGPTNRAPTSAGCGTAPRSGYPRRSLTAWCSWCLRTGSSP